MGGGVAGSAALQQVDAGLLSWELRLTSKKVTKLVLLHHKPRESSLFSLPPGPLPCPASALTQRRTGFKETWSHWGGR